MRPLAPLLLALVLAGCSAPGSLPPAASPTAPPATGDAPAVRLEPWLNGFDRPLLLVAGPNGAGLLVVEQGGLIWRVENDRSEQRMLWLDISENVSGGGEQGLLGLAFEPEHDRTSLDGVAYISYTDRAGDSILASVRHDGERAHADTERALLKVDQPYANHNGGHIVFGPDGFLWYGLGDGGSAGDPQGNGQDPAARLGGLLRLAIQERGYEAAPDNLWGDSWAKGLRNPWRFSFDRHTGDLYVADVGQNAVEELNVLRAPLPPGANFGWSAFEGTRRYGLIDRTFSPHTPPVAEYSHDDGCSVTGGHVYRGAAFPALQGIYFLADYCSGKLWGLRETEEGWRLVELLDTDARITSFGEDAEGELYVIDHGGRVLRLTGTEAPLPEPLRP